MIVDRISNALEKINCAVSIRSLSPIKAGPSEVQCFMPSDIGELHDVMALIGDRSPERPIIIGGCTNILISDSPVPDRMFLSLSRMRGIKSEGLLFTAQAGALLADLIEASLPVSASLAPLAGIPGTVGGAIAGNTGANGVTAGDFVESVDCMSFSGQTSTLSGAECGFSYRNSIFRTRQDLAVASVTFRLDADSGCQAEQVRRAALESRRQRGIGLEPSLGSFFKNPPGDHAGRLMEQAGLKGFVLGKAAVSAQHANIITNPGGKATAAEIFDLAKHCHDTVLKLYNIDLKSEVILYGFSI